MKSESFVEPIHSVSAKFIVYARPKLSSIFGSFVFKWSNKHIEISSRGGYASSPEEGGSMQDVMTTEAGLEHTSEEPEKKRYRNWRIVMFAIPWLIYVGFYLCRKNFPIAQPAIMEQFGWAKDQIYVISLVYLITYAIGQFVSGITGDKFGAKKVLTIGLGVTIVCNFLFGFSNTILMFAILYGINGFAQSTGWSLTVKSVANWFSLRERGTIMGWWVSCYTIGDVIAISLASALLGSVGWQYSFFVPAIIVAMILVVVFIGHRNRPENVGLPSIARYHGEPESADAAKEPSVPFKENLQFIMNNGPMWILGFTYFGLKLSRYTFLFWVNVYMVEKLGYRIDQAGFATILLPLAGFLGSLAAGYASDKFFGSRRAPVVVIMLVTLTAAIVLYFQYAHDVYISLALLALIGFVTYGSDSLVCGPATMDFASRRYVGFAAGFVNGMGSVGAILSSFVGGIITTKFGWGAAFYFVAAVVLVCAGLIATMWNRVGEN